MSDIRVTVVSAEAEAERTVTTGTKAWELFADDPTVIAARVGGELRDLAHELADGDEVEPVAIDSAGRPRHPAALDRARDGPGRAGALPGRQARHRPADRERLLLRLRRRDAVHARGPRRRSRSGCARSSRRASGSPAARSPTTTRATELADEPYKLELIGLKGAGQAEARRGRRASRSAAAS